MYSRLTFTNITLSAVLFSSLRPFAWAIISSDHWTDIANSTAYTGLSYSCAQPCLLGAGTTIRCWSYGCVCSENTPGPNFVQALNDVTACARSNCSNVDSNEAAAAASNAFQEICRVPYGSPTTYTASVTVLPTASPTAIFDRKCYQTPDM